jgi:hypothetical protein
MSTVGSFGTGEIGFGERVVLAEVVVLANSRAAAPCIERPRSESFPY